MRRIKALISIFLLTAFMLPMAVAVDAAENTEYQKSMDILISLGIMEGYSADDSENPVTRAEFAKMICNVVFGRENQYFGSENNYDDVKTSDNYYAAVNALNNMKIMVGYNNEFSPERNITYYEAVTSLVSLLGYGVNVSDYPNGYLKIAADISLLKNIADKSQHELTAAEAAALIYNTLHTDMVTLQLSGDRVSYKVEKDITPLNKNMNIYEGRGLYEANNTSGLYGSPTAAKGDILIDQVSYIAENYDEYLGYCVDFYYYDDGDEKEILYMSPSKNVSSITINTNEIESFENNVYCYTPIDAQRGKNARLANSPQILYNGRVPLQLSGNELFVPKNGYVNLIDNDNDSRYDVVMIWSFETYVVKSVSTQNQFSIVDYYDKEPLILDEDNGYNLRVIKDNEEADKSVITKWNVLSVAKSEPDNDYLVTVIVSDKRVTGTPRYDSDFVTIDDEDYPLSVFFNMEQKSGDIFDFYLDFMGNAAVYDPYSADTTKVFYGFVTAFTWTEDFETTPEMKIFTEEGEFVKYKLAKKLKIDGEKCRDSMTLTEHDNVLRNENGVVSQMIGYKLNKNKEINYIDTVYMGDGEDKKNAMNATQIYPKNVLNYLLLGRTFGDHIALSRKLKVFKVPIDANGKVLRDLSYDKYFQVVSGEPFKDHYDSYTVQFYNVNDAGTCELMVNYIVLDGTSDLLWTSRIVVVDSVSIALDENDEEIVKINGYQGRAKKVSFDVNSFASDEARKLKKGDIIQFGTDQEGKIGSIEIRYKADGENNYYLSNSVPYQMVRAVYGRVVAVDYDNYVFKTCYVPNANDPLAESNSLVSNMSGWSYDPALYDSQIMIYNRRDKSIREGDWGAIRVGQEIVMQKRETCAQSIVILED